MLEPAILYDSKLKEKFIGTWFNDKYKYYNGLGCELPTIEQSNHNKRQFVSISRTSEILGYLAYSVDYLTRTASNLGAICFKEYSPEFAADVCREVARLIEHDKFNRIEWWCIDGNPALRAYKNLAERYGGGIVGTLHRSVMMTDGELHDSYIFEILGENKKDD